MFDLLLSTLPRVRFFHRPQLIAGDSSSRSDCPSRLFVFLLVAKPFPDHESSPKRSSRGGEKKRTGLSLVFLCDERQRKGTRYYRSPHIVSCKLHHTASNNSRAGERPQSLTSRRGYYWILPAERGFFTGPTTVQSLPKTKRGFRSLWPLRQQNDKWVFTIVDSW